MRQVWFVYQKRGLGNAAVYMYGDFIGGHGDNHLCWKTADGYKSCELKFIGEYSFNSSFIKVMVWKSTCL